MQLLEKAVIDLLRNHTTLPNEKIFTGNRYRPYDVSPCITIQQASETPVSAKQIPGKYEIMPQHSFMDSDNPYTDNGYSGYVSRIYMMVPKVYSDIVDKYNL